MSIGAVQAGLRRPEALRVFNDMSLRLSEMPKLNLSVTTGEYRLGSLCEIVSCRLESAFCGPSRETISPGHDANQ